MKLRYPLLFILCLLFSTTAFGAVYTANETPGPGEFATIQDAVNMCTPTDSVEVIGTFNESVAITTPGITIFAGPGGGTIDGTVPAIICMTIGDGMGAGAGTIVDGLEIIYSAWDGIQIYDNNVTIKNSVFHHNTPGFVWALANYGGMGCTITDNCFFHNDVHIYDFSLVPLSNTYSGNSFEDFMQNPGYPNQYDIPPFFLQTDFSPSASVVTPDGPTTILYGEEATFALDYIADPACSDYQGAKAIEFTVTWNTNKVDYVGYADGDGMPGNGQYLIDESNTGTGSLVVTATSLDDVMFGDGNLGHVTFDMIGHPGETFKIFTNCLAYTLSQDTIPMVGGASALATITDDGLPTLAYTANNPFGDDYYNLTNPIVLNTIDVADDIDLDRAYWKIDGDWVPGGWTTIPNLNNAGWPVSFPPGVTTDADATYTVGGGGHPDGEHKLYLMVMDEYGNWSAEQYYTFYVDNTAPVFSFAVSDDDGCAEAGYFDGIAKIATTIDDATGAMMQYAWRPAAGSWTYSGWVPFAAEVMVDLTAEADGLYDFAVQVKDSHDNATSYSYVYNMTLDQTDCAVGFTIAPDLGTTLDIAYTGTDGCGGGGNFQAYIVTENAAELDDCASSNWVYSWPPTGTFSLTDAGCGVYTVYFGIRDDAGNVVSASDTYRYDDCAPVVTAVAVADQDGTDCSDSWTVDVTVDYTVDAFDTGVWVRFSLDGSTWGTWTALADLGATSETFVGVDLTTLPGFVGAPTDCGDMDVYAQLVDDLSNYSNTDVFGTFHRDCYDPSFTQVRQRDLDYPTDGDGVPIHYDWSNSSTVNLEITGVVEDSDFDFVISEDAGFTAPTSINVDDAAVTDLGGGDYDVEYTYVTAPADGAAATLWVKLVTCADRESSVETDALNFDYPAKAAAYFNSFDAVSAYVNYLTAVAFNVDAQDDESCVHSMKIYEAGYQSLASWASFATPATVDLQDLGDGERTVRIKVADMAGNVTGPAEATVTVDTEGPVGAFTIVSTNPDAYPGPPHAYTNTPSCELILEVPADCNYMFFQNWDKPGGTWAAATYQTPTAPGTQEIVAWSIDYTTNLAFDTVRVGFRDAAMNWTYVVGHIFVDAPSTAPPAFLAMADEGVYFGDGTHCGVWWDNDYPDHYFSKAYYLRWGFYPEYEGVIPPQPTDAPAQGFYLGDIPEGYNAFLMGDEDDPTEDIYRFGIYNVDSAGNATLHSPYPSMGVDALSASYILGDLDFDGGLSFMESDAKGIGDFARFAQAYYSVDGGTYWDNECDFADNLDNFMYPEPDNVINLFDLMDFVINYTYYADGWNDKTSQRFFTVDYDWDAGVPKIAPHAPVAINATIPDRLAAGEEITVSFTISDPSEILGLHMVFDHSDNIEVVKVAKGDMFDTSEKTFFYNSTKDNELLIDGAIFSRNGFESQEIAQVTFRAETDIANFVLEDVEFTVRDNNNVDVEAAFNTTVEKVAILPTEFSLGQNYPNPFNPATTIEMALPVASNYKLDIYNVAGQRVTEFSGYSEAGIVNITWDASDCASGVYFYKMKAGSFEATKKMVMIK